MRTSLCSNSYNETGCRRSAERGRGGVAWDALLPRGWRTQAVVPVEFDVFHEYEMAAERSIGRDADGLPCFYAHRYALQELRSDDDEDFYLAIAYAESLTAWRLRDGRWLSHRCSGGEQGQRRGFFALGPDSPLDRPPGPLIADPSGGC